MVLCRDISQLNLAVDNQTVNVLLFSTLVGTYISFNVLARCSSHPQSENG